MSVYRDRDVDSMRLFQLNACSFSEITRILTTAVDNGWESVVIVCQNFELLNQRKNRPDPIVLRRFRKLCRYLDRSRDRFEVAGFTGLQKPDEHL